VRYTKTSKQVISMTCRSGIQLALYIVLRVVVAKYMKWPFSTPRRTKHPLTKKSNDYVVGTTKYRSKFLIISGGITVPHVGEVVNWRSFLRCFVWLAHSRPRALEFYVLFINRCYFGQRIALEWSHQYTSSLGGVIPQNLSLWGRQWGFSV
jgi:hypothetical protein